MWLLVLSAARGDSSAREMFVQHFEPVVRRHLRARWRNHPLRQDLDDAAQQVLLDCVREGGALTRAEPCGPGGFPAFLFGVTRRVAQKIEAARMRRIDHETGMAAELVRAAPDAPSLAQAMDREHARSLLAEAHHRLAAKAVDPAAHRRIELLRLRLEENLPVRAIAAEWHAEPTHVHREYARARREFRNALHEIMSRHPHCPAAERQAHRDRLLELMT